MESKLIIIRGNSGSCEFVIVEGILNKKRYGEMLNNLIQFFNHNHNA